MVHCSDATLCPILPLNAETPLRLKSPSSPCPTASCNKMPGQPLPRTTGMVPAGAGCAFELYWQPGVRLRARNRSGKSPSTKVAEICPARRHRSIRARAWPSCSRITLTLRRISGRTSAAIVPSDAATSISSWLLAKLIITCSIRLVEFSCSRASSSSSKAGLLFVINACCRIRLTNTKPWPRCCVARPGRFSPALAARNRASSTRC